MDEMTNVHGTDVQMDARRREIELRIEMNRDAAAGSLLEVGRWLNAAKDEGVVPHGQWTAWVAEHAMMNDRTAQKWMQAARELPPGSSLERLGITKIQSLMMLPAGEREDFAEQIGADRLSSREVDAQVKAARAERDEALRLVEEQKKRLQEMGKEMHEAVVDAESRTRRALRDEIERLNSSNRESGAEIDRLNHIIEKNAIEKRKMANLRDQAIRLREALEAERAKASSGPDPEQQERIALLETQLKSRDQAIREQEREIDRLSEALDEAQTAAMRGGMAGEGERTNPATMILSAIGALMAQAGRAPAELARMQGLDDETRSLLAGQARMAGQWCMQVLAACGEGDGHA